MSQRRRGVGAPAAFVVRGRVAALRLPPPPCPAVALARALPPSLLGNSRRPALRVALRASVGVVASA
jgi:hypothetical protein